MKTHRNAKALGFPATAFLFCALLSVQAWSQGTWNTIAPMPTARAGLNAAAVGTRVYAIGGHVAGCTATNRVEVLDTASGSWTPAAPMPTARGSAGAAVVGSRIYVTGGNNFCSGSQATLEIFDSVTGTWSAGAPMPRTRRTHGSAALNGLVYVVGGRDDSSSEWLVTQVDVYDPATNAWHSVAPMPSRIVEPAVVALGGKLYVTGDGLDSANNIFIYDPATNAWSERAGASPSGLEQHVAAVLEGILHVAGGRTGAPAVNINRFEFYDPVVDAFIALPPMSRARALHAGAVVGNTLYVMGGFSNESAAPWLASVESYQSSPADVQPPESQALASPEANYAGWNAAPVSVAITAIDEGSGVASLRVVVTGPQPRVIDGPGSDASFVLSADGVHTIRFQATDAAGNIETEKVHVVRIDQRAPEASAAGTPAPNAQGWNTGPVVVRVTSSDDDDGSGVAYLEYTAMGPKRASAPLAAQGLRSPGPSAEVTMVAQGVSTMTYRAVDAAGNASPWATLPVRIDSIAPAIAASASPPPNADGWNRGPVTIALSATDAVPGSGIARIQYSVTSDTFASVAEEPGSSASVTVAREGTSRVDYRAYDVAGHVSADGSLTVRIDATPPTGTLVATPSSIWPPNRQLVPIALDLQVADSGGGPVRVSGPTVTATGGSAAAGDWVVRDGQVWLRAVRDGGAIGRIYTITYVATDLAGNSAPIATTVRVAHEARQ